MEANQKEGGLTRPPPPPLGAGGGGGGADGPSANNPALPGVMGAPPVGNSGPPPSPMQYAPAYGRWSPVERGPGQGAIPLAPGYLRRARKVPMGPTLAMGPLNRQQVPPSKPKEPDQDEAFVEESGIKLFESRPQTDDDDDQDDEVEDEDDDDDGEVDPLYELDVLDDTIVEEGEDEEEEETKIESSSTTTTTTTAATTTAKKKDDDKENTSVEAKVKADKVSSEVPNNTLTVSSLQEDFGRTERSSSTGSSSCGSNNSSGNIQGTANNSNLGNKNINGSLTSNASSISSGGVASGASKRDSCSSGSSRDSGMSEVWAAPEPFARNRPGRLSLPAVARPTHQFIIRRVAEAEAPPARRASDFIDNRLAELRTPEVGGGGRSPHSLVSDPFSRSPYLFSFRLVPPEEVTTVGNDGRMW